MELRRRFDAKLAFFGFLVLIFVLYLIIGFYPAGATNNTTDPYLEMPSIGIWTKVTELEVAGGKLETPDLIAGSYSVDPSKILLIGHSTSVFTDLYKTKLLDRFYYDHQTYKVVKIDVVEKARILMSKILAHKDKNTVIIMTCAGKNLPNNDATHRLIITGIAE